MKKPSLNGSWAAEKLKKKCRREKQKELASASRESWTHITREKVKITSPADADETGKKKFKRNLVPSNSDEDSNDRQGRGREYHRKGGSHEYY